MNGRRILARPNSQKARAGVLFAVCVLCLAIAGPVPGGAGEKAKDGKRKKEAASYALLFGTVFDETGRLVRGAQVQVREKDGKRHWEQVTDSQGEFAVHLPAGAAVYIVEASAPRATRDSKEVSFTSDERQDVVLRISRQEKHGP